jgi:RepB plasmid partitioning protein
MAGKKPRKLTGVSLEQMAKMEREKSNLQGQYKLAGQNYGQDALNLVLAKGYLAKLLENESARQYVAQRHPDLVAEFESIIATISLDQQQFSAVL